LRVAVVTETYPPEINGVAMTVARVVDGLIESGHEVELVRPRQGCAGEGSPRAGLTELLTGGWPVPRYPGLRLGVPSGGLLRAAWERHRPDVVHVATEGPLGWSAVRAAGRLGIPVVSEFRTHFDAYSRFYGIGCMRGAIRAYLRWFHNRTACTMVPTQALADELGSAGFRRLEVVGRGVDTGRFDPVRRDVGLRRRWGAGDGTLVVLSVGRVAPEKNLGLLEKAFAAIRVARPDSRLVIVGDGPARGEMEARCPDAVFAGKRFGGDLAAHYASADLMLFPSLTETFGNVTPEAMASGLPVLAFGYAAAGEVIRHGESGWVVAYGDEAAYAREATAVARDLDGVRRAGAAARIVACRMGWDRIVGQIEGHYRRAMGIRPPVGAGQPGEAGPHPWVAGASAVNP